jgi:hypothetical protein
LFHFSPLLCRADKEPEDDFEGKEVEDEEEEEEEEEEGGEEEDDGVGLNALVGDDLDDEDEDDEEEFVPAAKGAKRTRQPAEAEAEAEDDEDEEDEEDEDDEDDEDDECVDPSRLCLCLKTSTHIILFPRLSFPPPTHTLSHTHTLCMMYNFHCSYYREDGEEDEEDEEDEDEEDDGEAAPPVEKRQKQ